MAEAGIGHAALIVLAAVALILMAVLAAIGICERCHVQSGGVYFLISHVLGSRRGTAIGILYVLGQVLLNIFLISEDFFSVPRFTTGLFGAGVVPAVECVQ